MKKTVLALLLLVILLSCQTRYQPEYRGLTASNGMVVCAHPEASEIGLNILRTGGNAIDAACAVEFALAVCYPNAGNIGGGGFWVVRHANGEVASLDYREKAPLKAHRDMFLDADGQVISGMSTQTILAAGVPGTVAGMLEAHSKAGVLDWKNIIQPAIDLAEKGFPVTDQQAKNLNSIRRSLIERNTEKPDLLKTSIWRPGDTLKQPDLAKTLIRIRDHKREGFYAGETADMIVNQMQKSGGIIGYEDLKEYKAVWRDPIRGSFRGYEFYSMPPPSSGGIALYQLLTIVSEFDLLRYGLHSPEAVHLIVEAEKRVYADRATWLGDPAFFIVPVQQLLDPEYLRMRSEQISLSKTTDCSEIAALEWMNPESEETTHYSVVDQYGNAVAGTTTLNGGYGSRIVVEGAGFLLNNQMDDFSVKPGHPNIYGLIGGEANSIEAGKKMLSSMTPTILTKNDELFMVVGSPGGSTIITSVFQTILNVIEFGLGMQEAVDQGRFHHQCWPDHITMEEGALDSTVVERLRNMGHSIEIRSSIGRVDAILVLEDGRFESGADKRGDDTAKGY